MDDRETPAAEPDWGWLARYVAGELTEAEGRWVRAWARATPTHATLLADVERVWAASPTESRWRDANEVLAYIKANTLPAAARLVPHSQSVSVPSPSRSPVPRTPFLRPLPRGAGGLWISRRRVAGIVAATLAIGLGITWSSAGRRTGPSSRQYMTARAQRETVLLPDGTQLSLAPSSHARLGTNYGRVRREVWLDGEGYFVVRHDAAHPFAVHAGDAVATDVGTAFDVRSYEGDRAVRVAVAEGRVSVTRRVWRHRSATPPTPNASLAPGDVALVSDTSIAVAHGGDAARAAAWTTGEIVFTKVPLREVLVDLARWYDLDVRLGDAGLGDRPVTASFKNEPLDDVLAGLAATFGVRYSRTARAVIFAPRSQ